MTLSPHNSTGIPVCSNDALSSRRASRAGGEGADRRVYAQLPVSDGMLLLQVQNEEFVRGVTGKVHFALTNTGEEEIEIVTATGAGASASNEIVFKLLDGDGNVLSTIPYKQSLGSNVITLSNGNTVARIAPGAVYTSASMELFVPIKAPNTVYAEVAISKVYFHPGKSEEVVMSGPGGRQQVNLVDTSYYGEVTNVSPAVSNGDQDIVISGHAVERATGQPLPEAPLNLTISVSGFERTYKVSTDSNGAFTYTFTPLATESGVYKVWAIHPEILDKPAQAQFTVNRVMISPATANLSVPKNYEQQIPITVSTGDGTIVYNVRLVLEEADQPGGSLPQGVHVTPGEPVFVIGSRQTATLALSIWGDSTVDATETIVLRVKSDEKQSAWGTVTVNMQFSDAQPALYFTPNHIETGAAFGDSVSESVTLENRGLADLNDVSLSLRTQDGQAVPSWVHLNSPASQGTIAVGETRPVSVSFTPTDTNAIEGNFTFALRVVSSNYRTVDIPIYVSVTQSGIGNALFKVSDIYTGTQNSGGQLVQGLSGANITIQNEQVLTIQRSAASDAAGEAYFTNLPSGRYKYRVTASNHQERIGRIWVKAGITANEIVFLDYNLVTVEWEVRETTIQDKYEIVLKTTYETHVPAAVVIAEPASITLPDMKAGDVYFGEFTVTNYGLIRADNMQFTLPNGGEYFKYEILAQIPANLAAKERITVSYRVTCLKSFTPDADGGASGGGCVRSAIYGVFSYGNVCANGVLTTASLPYAIIFESGECTGAPSTPGTPTNIGGGGSGSGGSWNIGYVGGGGSSGGSPAPAPTPIEGIKCMPKPGRQPPAGCPTQPQKLDQLQQVESTVNCTLREYNDSVSDLTVKVPGGSIEASREFYANDWHFAFTKSNLLFTTDSLGQSVKAVESEGVSFELSNTDASAPVYANETYTIARQANGYLWQDKGGNWKSFRLDGKMTAYGLRTGLVATLLYEAETDRLTGVTDRNGQQLLWFGYDTGGRLSEVRDSSNRKVKYTWTGGHLSGVKDVLGNTSAYEYDAKGRLVKKTNAAGHQTTIGYDTYGNVTKVVDEAGVGHFFQFDYDSARQKYYAQIKTSSGNLKEVWYDRLGDTERVDVNGETRKKIVKDGRNLIATDERGYVTRFEYDEWQNLTRVLYPDGSSVTSEYEHKFNKKTKETDELGVVTLYAYDAAGNLTQKTEAAGTTDERITRFTYDSLGQLLTIKRVGDAKSAEALTTITYDASGNPSTLTDPEGNVTQFTAYDAMGNVLTKVDAAGKSWTYVYDDAGRLTSVADPLAHSTQIFYDAVGNTIRAIDPEEHTSLFEYDDHNRLVRATDPLGNITLFAYNTDGKMTQQTDPEGKILQYLYDSEGRLVKAIDGNENETRIQYETTTASGCSTCSGTKDLPSKIIFPTFTREFKYDSRARKTQETDVLSETESYSSTSTYDAAGNLLSTKDKESKTTATTYDALRRPKTTVDAASNTTGYTYDNRDNLLTLTDPNGNSTRFEYDRNNRKVKEVRPMGEATILEVDSLGRVKRSIDPKGQAIRYNFDDAGRLTQTLHFSHKDDTTPAKTVGFTYDRKGSLTGYTDGTTSGTYVYDDASRMATETVDYGTFQLTNTYDWYGNGKQKSFTGPDGIAYDYAYDANNQLLSVAIPGKGFITTNQFTWMKPASVSLPGGTTKEFSYDPLMRLKSIQVKDPGGNPLLNYGYTFDKTDHVLSKTTEHGPYAYTYDNLYQLTRADKPQDQQDTYTYDPVGNRLTQEGIQGNWTYDANNQLGSYGSVSFAHDLNGNTTRKTVGSQVTSLVYDIENRLIRVESGAGAIIAQYGYDPFGRRLWKEVGSTRTYFHYAASGLVGEYDATGTELKTYGYRPESVGTSDPLFLKEGANYYFYHNDHLGTPVQLTSRNGAVVWEGTYDSFGNTTVDTASTVQNNLRFPGQYYDAETGLHYNHHRYYDPETGRYISEDPLGFSGGDVNLYAYVLNNPINSIDTYGLFDMPLLPQGAVNGIAGFGDGLTLGVGRALRNWAGLSPMVDENSGPYMGGAAAGYVATVYASAGVSSILGPVGVGAVTLTGQNHHAISAPIFRALERSSNLAGKYIYRDPRFVTQARDLACHRGYQAWHRALDEEIVAWIESNGSATSQQFDSFLLKRYSAPDLTTRFPNGL